MVIKNHFLCHFHFETEFMWTNLLILWKNYWQLILSQTLIFRRGSWKCGLLFDCPYNFRVNCWSSRHYGRWNTESIPSQRHSDPKSIIHLEIQLFQIAFLTCFFFSIFGNLDEVEALKEHTQYDLNQQKLKPTTQGSLFMQ